VLCDPLRGDQLIQQNRSIREDQQLLQGNQRKRRTKSQIPCYHRRVASGLDKIIGGVDRHTVKSPEH
jgi:hypothetical protein